MGVFQKLYGVDTHTMCESETKIMNDNAQGKKKPHEINAVRMLKNNKATCVYITAEMLRGDLLMEVAAQHAYRVF